MSPPKKYHVDSCIESLCLLLNGEKSKSSLALVGGRMAGVCIKGFLSQVRVKIDMGASNVMLQLEGFFAPCVFQFGIGNSNARLNLGMIDVTEQTDCPFPLKSTVVNEHLVCMQCLFEHSWKDWEPVARLLLDGNGEAVVCEHQCTAYFSTDTGIDIAHFVETLTVLVSSPPFTVQSRFCFLTRYSDIPGFAFNASNVPPDLQELISLAKEWCFSSEEEVFAYAKKMGRSRTKKYGSRFREHADAINSFCCYAGNAPVPTEVIVFQLAGHAFALLCKNEATKADGMP